jgi:hypothetical protein
MLFTLYWVAYVAEYTLCDSCCLFSPFEYNSGLCYKCCSLCCVFLLHAMTLTQLIGPCLLPHHVYNNLWPRGVRNFVLAASTEFLLNFIEYKGERENTCTRTHTKQNKWNTSRAWTICSASSRNFGGKYLVTVWKVYMWHRALKWRHLM